jgi:peroxiredoxin
MTSNSLTEQLAEFKAGFKTRATPERVATMEQATQDLRDSGIENSALQVGQAAPDLTLPNAVSKPIALAALWAQGPLVVVFYRGGWCPYCNLELRAWQALLPQLNSLGAQIVAISPQLPDNSLSTAQKNALAFEVLSDSALHAANGFGLAFEMPESLIQVYKTVGHDLPNLNGNGRWVLPVPATYLIDRQGIIQYAHIDADYRNRAEPADIIEQIKKLA